MKVEEACPITVLLHDRATNDSNVRFKKRKIKLDEFQICKQYF
jgi:hypothetical protein